MRWKKETPEEKRDRLKKWKPWFAWYPVIVGGERVWLEQVYKSTTMHRLANGSFEYNTKYTDVMLALKDIT